MAIENANEASVLGRQRKFTLVEKYRQAERQKRRCWKSIIDGNGGVNLMLIYYVKLVKNGKFFRRTQLGRRLLSVDLVAGSVGDSICL